MRTFIFLCCTLVFSFNPDKGFSQNTTIQIDQDQIVSLHEVLKLIESQTDYSFIFRPEHVKNAPKVILKKGLIKTSKLLNKVLADVDCLYEFTDDTIVIYKKRNEKLKNSQDEFIINGRIKNTNGESLFGASVVISGSGFKSPGVINPSIDPSNVIRSTQTDFDGSFSIKASEGQVLSVAFIEHKYFEITISRDIREYLIELQPEINTLDEVVITGYTRTVKKESTVASSKITKEELQKQKTINLDDRLVGAVPGLILNSSNPDGGRSRLELVLRGVSTFDEPDTGDFRTDARNLQNRQPLIVLDGFPYEGPFNDIDPNTIETIDVLRDAAATALWGVRASNGVIVITSKRGNVSSKTKVSFTSNITIGTKQDLNNLDLANAKSTIDALNLRAPSFKAQTVSSTAPNTAPNDIFASLNAYDEIWAQSFAGIITDQERDARLDALGNNNVLQDFENHLLRPTIIRENSLNIGGGSTLAAYSFTATHVDEQRQDIGDDFQRLSLNLNTDLKINKKLNAILDVSTVFSETQDNGLGVASLFNSSANGINIFDRLVDKNGNPRETSNVYTQNRADFTALGFDDAAYNPILDQRLRDNENKTFNLRLAAGIKYKITEKLIADVKYQFNRVRSETNNNKPVNLYETRLANNSFIAPNGIISPTNPQIGPDDRSVPYGGTLENQINLTTNTTLRGSLNYKTTLNENHNISALAGIEFFNDITSFNRRTLYGYDDRTGLYDRFYNPPAPNTTGRAVVPSYLFPTTFPGTGAQIRSTNDFSPEFENRTVSSFGNIAYNYKGKYNLSFSGKIDQASSFGINERLSKPFLWAVSGAWNIAEEDFINSSNINVLKLRASYGINGNLRTDQTTNVVIRYNARDFITRGRDAQIVRAGNPNLTFEETATKNIGLDFGLFKNRLQGTIDVYEKESTNLLSRVLTNGVFGQQGLSTFANNGGILNKGIEVSLNLDILRDTKFKWNTNFNFSYNKNEVLANGTPESNVLSSILFRVNSGVNEIIGEDISAQYKYEWAGLDENGNPQVLNDTGDAVTNTSSALPTRDALVVTKPFNAPGFGGFRNTFTYNNFSLSFLAIYKFGHVFQENLQNKYIDGITKPYHKDIANAWQNPGDEANTNIPRADVTSNLDRRDFFTDSNFGIHDASFIRLRDVTLGYSLDSKIVKKVGFTGVNLTLQARNLGLIWKANNVDLDPESVPFSGRPTNNTENFSEAFRPGIRPITSFVLGAQLTF